MGTISREEQWSPEMLKVMVAAEKKDIKILQGRLRASRAYQRKKEIRSSDETARVHHLSSVRSAKRKELMDEMWSNLPKRLNLYPLKEVKQVESLYYFQFR